MTTPSGSDVAPPPHANDGQVDVGRVLLLPLVPAVALALTAPVKIILDCSAATSLAGAIVATALVTYALLRMERAPSQPVSAATLIALALAQLVIAGVMVRLLYNPYVFGMANVSYQPDAGTHVMYSKAFMEHTGPPPPYEGCLSFHAFMWWLGRIFDLDPLRQLRLCFYFLVVMLPLACASLAAAVLPRRASPVLCAVAFVALMAVVAQRELVPLLHGFQSLASYPQLLTLLPLFLGWALHANCRTAGARLVAAILAIGMMRYTYGLNLGDQLAAYSLLALVELGELRGILKRLLSLAVAIGLGLAAYRVYQRLLDLQLLDGPRPMVGLALEPAMMGQLIGAVALAAAPAFLRLTPSARRTLRFAAVFGLATAVSQWLYLRHGLPSTYYIFKYQFSGPFVVSVGLALAALSAFEDLVARAGHVWRPSLALLLVIGVMVRAFGAMDDGFAYYALTATERAHGKPPFDFFDPLGDPDVIRLIRRILAKQHKPFGGFYSPRWAYAAFMNMELDGPALTWYPYFTDPNFVPGGGPDFAAGHCYFWDSPSEAFVSANRPHARKIRELEATANRACYRYQPRWLGPEVDARICSACY